MAKQKPLLKADEPHHSGARPLPRGQRKKRRKEAIGNFMVKQNNIKIFEEHKVRTIWDSEKEEWFFSVIDVVALLTDNDHQTARNYWKVLKSRLKKEGNESVTNL